MGSDLYKVDKNPLIQMDQGIEDVIGRQAKGAGGQMTSLLQSLLQAILGLPLGGLITAGLDDLFRYGENLLAFLGELNPLDPNFDLIAAAQDFIKLILFPVDLLGPMDPLLQLLFPFNIPGLDASKILTGLFPQSQIMGLEDDLNNLFGAILSGDPAAIIEAITGIVGGTIPQLETYFNSLEGMLGLPAFGLTNLPFDPIAAVENFIMLMLQPTKLLAPLINGFIPGLHIPGLDASKITTGTFADNFVPGLGGIINTVIGALGGGGLGLTGLGGLTSVLQNIPGANIIGSIAGQLISGILPPGVIPGIDASKIISGLLPQSQVAGLPTDLLGIFTQLGAPVAQWLLPMIPIGAIGNTNPNLLGNPGFDTAGSLSGENLWTWDQTVTHTPGSSGSAKAVANGSLMQLYSDPTIPVSAGQTLNCSIWLKWSGVVGTGLCFKLSVTGYNAGALVGEVPMQSLSNVAATGNWQQLTGTYTVPQTGVDSIRTMLTVTPSVTSGSTWWDDGNVSKTGLLAQSWTAGLPGDLANLLTGINARALLTDFDGLLNTLGLGNPTLDAIFQRLEGLDITGFLDAGFLFNMLNIPGLPALAIPGLDASKIIGGIMGIGQIPTALLGITNIADLQGLVNNVINVLGNLNPFMQAGSLVNVSTVLGNLQNTVVQLTQAFQGLTNLGTSQQAGATEGVKALALAGSGAINFATEAIGALPSTVTTIYNGVGSSIQQLMPSQIVQTATGIVNAAVTATWSLVPDGVRSALNIFNPAPTGSNYQLVGITTAGAGGQGGAAGAPGAPGLLATGPLPYNRIVARSDANGQNYVFADLTQDENLVNYVQMGCVVGGVTTLFTDPKPYVPSGVAYLQAGTDTSPRQYQVMSGTAPILKYLEPGTFSQMGPNFQAWGWGSLVAAGGKAPPQSITGVSGTPNIPGGNVGSTFRAQRTGTATVNVASGNSHLPTSFFGSLDYVTNDITWAPTGNRITVGVEGTYAVLIRYKLAATAAGLQVDPIIFHTGSVTKTYRLGGNFADVGGDAASAVSGLALIYARPGDVLEAGIWASAAVTGMLTGEASGMQTYFEAALVNRSMA